MPAPRQIDIAVELASVQRRLSTLEMLTLGRVLPELTPQHLRTLYIRASRTLMAGEIPAESVSGWAHAAMLLDEVTLLAMGRLVDDPHPWVPLLQLIRWLRSAASLQELRAAEAHLRSIARGLLDAQGLQDVGVDDLLARELPIVGALNRLLGTP